MADYSQAKRKYDSLNTWSTNYIKTAGISTTTNTNMYAATQLFGIPIYADYNVPLNEIQLRAHPDTVMRIMAEQPGYQTPTSGLVMSVAKAIEWLHSQGIVL